MDKPFFVSAPGKVILFGEHSAVYGKPAIAAALSLRTYLLVTPNQDPESIRLDFPDIQLSHSWKKSELPFEQSKPFIQYEEGLPKVSTELIPEIVDKLSILLADMNNTFHYKACISFLYLYLHLCGADVAGVTMTVRSTVPIGAGLGSSACVSVCLAAALSMIGGHITKPPFGLREKADATDVKELDFIDQWSFIGEKMFHGNPSGIDNAVATHGGAVMFQRMTNPSQPSVRTTMRNFPPLKMLLTNTKVPRSTAHLVSDVSRINSEYSKICEPILDAMGSISTTAYQLMIEPNFDELHKQKLRQLASVNHGLLVALGVSHPALEQVKMIADIEQIGVTKLTGAGGGGCAITLVDDSVAEEKIQQVISQYTAKGFECYETSLGGKGVGALFMDDCNHAVFAADAFAKFGTRADIEQALHFDVVGDWKFW
ncbi:Mevalonate kinase [Yamadazyma tenuis]|uniref:Mevalonate kinase n=1 Tax=Candida tenuis (strain ATCC 10573 / BCRC 21748 / CBS 615 / JCM 9827 / NBRC 10315 / NRRL Y-1498 / VKM Y-70) TaxID=590646 RepID=G3BEK7_CANTC|nr:mevalonate kinase [Yamadazyma tenuis ATCC 10573]EGV60568.1 mevalonate kinase [Yamadazyma tenuis ATCC 10573]WEJ94188.1 Mevalonate kinase [Yamadazyma tenuis]